MQDSYSSQTRALLRKALDTTDLTMPEIVEKTGLKLEWLRAFCYRTERNGGANEVHILYCWLTDYLS